MTSGFSSSWLGNSSSCGEGGLETGVSAFSSSLLGVAVSRRGGLDRELDAFAGLPCLDLVVDLVVLAMEFRGGLMGRLKREITVDQTGMDPQRKSTGLYKKRGFCQKNVAKVTLVTLGDKCDVSVTRKKALNRQF